jgi:hypothetical protein
MNPPTNKRAAVEAIRAEFKKSRGTNIWMDYVNALRLISQVVFTRSSGFVLELIQNAEDAGHGLLGKGEISISVNKHRLKFVHNGGPFDESNLRAICGIRSSKKPERGTLGYLGIGFKSVFKVADCAEVYSNGFSFKFDRDHEEWAAHVTETPWHVIPVWMEQASEPVDPEKTTFIIQLRNEEAYKHLMEGLKAIRAELYLFLKWIKRISITDEMSRKTWIVEDLGSTSDGITTLNQDGIEHRFRFFRREVTVPEYVKPDRLTQEYRANVTKREIAIAFAINKKGDLDPSPSTAMYGGVYSFLPLGEAKSGAKFPIQADFLVQPGRDSINAEALWNHWLLEEVTTLCKEAIQHFQQHDVWKYQYLAAFEFKRSPGFEAYEKLFGPKLIDPIETLINDSLSVPTANEKWAKPSDVVFVDESLASIRALSELGILSPDEIAPIFGCAPNLTRVHPKVVEAQPNRFKKVNRWTFFENEDFFGAKAHSHDGPAWFRRLYFWLNKYPVYEDYYKLKKRVIGYHSKEIVLRADKSTSTGGTTSLLDLGTADQFIANLAFGLQREKPMLHPDILGGDVDEKEIETIKGFLIGLVGVQKIDSRTVCLEAIVPKIITAAPQPEPGRLMTLTKYCQGHLQPADLGGAILWIVNKEGHIREASRVLFPVEFKPARNWELNRQYVPGADFLTSDYVISSEGTNELRRWRDFMRAGGVKETPDNGVEVFAVNFVQEMAASTFRNVVPVEKLNLGYDLQGEDASGEKAYIEVKGLSSDGDVELTGNEAKSARAYGARYYVCVVSGIPEIPALHIVRDPDNVGERDKLTIRMADWKRERVDTAS